MRSATATALLAFVCVFAAGCLPLSLEPLYTGEGDVVFEQALVGRWRNEERDGGDEEERWEITGIEGEDAYIVRRLDAPRSVQFRGVLVRVGERRFLDLTPTGHEPEVDPAFAINIVPAHSIWRVTVQPDRLRFALPDIDKLVTLLTEKPELIRHRLTPATGDFDEPDVLLTDTSAHFQAFVRDHLADDFFTHEIVLLPLDPAAADPASDAPAPPRSDQP